MTSYATTRRSFRREYGAQSIASFLRSIKVRRDTFMELARLAPQIDSKMQMVIEEWDKLSGSKQIPASSIEHICRLRGIAPYKFLAAVGVAALKFRDNAQIIVAAMNAPLVVDRLAKEAVKPGRVKATRMFLQHTGFLPTPKGAESKILHLNSLKAEQNMGVEGLPSFESTVMEVDEIIKASEAEEKRNKEAEKERPSK